MTDSAQTSANTEPLPPDLLQRIGAEAADLARLAGAQIESTLGRTLAVRYKSGADAEMRLRNPVSEVDQHVETMIRAELAERFPGHDIIGEEIDDRPGRDGDFVWAIDPVDGTANFINGFPLFAASVGVLFKGRPVAGAVWCASSHALKPGVYHAIESGPLHFDAEPLVYAPNALIERRLAGNSSAPMRLANWDIRKTGSAAIECAFVAAGLLEIAHFESVNLWDVAGGICLAKAAGCTVFTGSDSVWRPMERFEVAATAGPGDLQTWRSGILMGRPAAVAQILAAE